MAFENWLRESRVMYTVGNNGAAQKYGKSDSMIPKYGQCLHRPTSSVESAPPQ